MKRCFVLLSILYKRVEEALRSLGFPSLPHVITRSAKPEFGDFTSNVALLVGKQAKANPLLIAQQLSAKLNEDASLFHTNATAPGFVNFFGTQALFNVLLERWETGQLDLGEDFKTLKVNIEFVSANPTGSLHLGHARNGAVGDTLARAMTYMGHFVEREYYVNDGGNQIDMLVESVRLRCEQVLTGKEAVIPEGGYQSADVLRIAEEIIRKYKTIPDSDTLRLAAVAHFLAKIKQDLLDYGVKFDLWFSEAAVYADDHRQIKQVVDRLKKAGKTYEHEGALFLSTIPDGDDKDRVIVKSDGTYSYLLPDIVHHDMKFAKGYDLYINVFGADHYSYITRLKSAVHSLGYDDNKLKVLTIQLVRMVKDGAEYKMSKRSGTAIGLSELVEAIGVDAARWYMIDRSTDTHTEIDVTKALAKDASNPVYYVQYAHARCNQLLATAGQTEPAKAITDETIIRSAAPLLVQMALFDRMLRDAVAVLEPHRIANYLYETAKQFHSYYASNKIIDENDLSASAQRLAIVHALRKLLAQGLSLLGVSAPARM